MTLPDKAIFFDLDGVLYRGTSGLPHAKEAVDLARIRGIRLSFITNNSTRTPERLMDRLAKYDIIAHKDEVMSSALATAEYIKVNHGEGGNAYVIGREGIWVALESIDVKTIPLEDETKCDYVVIGMSPDFNYQQLARAQFEILENGAKFIGTNGDLTFPWNDGIIRPGAGTIVAAVRACTSVEPIIIGKPQLHMIEQVAATYGIQPENILVVGDRLDTDIVQGNRFGAHTLLVLTGISTRKEADAAIDDRKPDFVIDDMSGFEGVLDRLWS